MALTLYATQILAWEAGEFDSLSIHLTERGAKRRLIDYMVSELMRMSEWDEEIAGKLVELHDEYGCLWNDNMHRIENFEIKNTAELYYDLQKYCRCIHNIAMFEYKQHTLEG